VFPSVVSAGHSATEDVDCHCTTGMVDAAGSSCVEGSDHDSTDWVVPGTSTRSLAKGWYVDKYYFKSLVLEASSS